MLVKPPAAAAIFVMSSLLIALTRFKPAAAVLASALPDKSAAVDAAPNKLSLFKSLTILRVFPASAKEMPSAIIVLDASLPSSGSDTKAPTMPIALPSSKALITLSPVATSDIPPTPANEAMPPNTSPRSIAMAALIACANGARAGTKDAIAKIGARSPMSLLDACVV